MHFRSWQSTIGLTISMLGIITSLWWPLPMIGIIGLGGFLIFGSFVTGDRLLGGVPGKFGLGLVALGSAITVVHSLVYFVSASTPNTIAYTFGGFWLMLVSLSWTRSPQTLTMAPRTVWSSLKQLSVPVEEFVLPLLLIFLQVWLVYLTTTHTTTDALISPWTALGKKFICGYALSTFFLFVYEYRTRYTRLGLALLVSHAFVTFSITAILYPLGYGFDPFIHRATEQFIYSHGFALPKTPFYLGQYALVNILARIIGMSAIKIIDIWLLPTLATLLLPLSAYFGLRYGFRLKETYARIAPLFIFLYPLETMYATTPHNLANLFTLAVILLSPLLWRERRAALPIGLLALAALACHPETGLFAVLLVLALVTSKTAVWRRCPKQLRTILTLLYGVLVATAAPAMFALYLLRQGNPLASPSSILEHLDLFWSFFREPYYFSHRPVPFLYTTIYTYRLVIILALLFLALIGWWWNKNKKGKLLMFFAPLIVVNTFLVSTWIVFPNLHIYDQLQYSDRLLYVSVLFLLPLVMVGSAKLLARMARRPAILTVAFVGLSVGITTSLYLMYPQQNPKVHFPGFNVTKSDVLAAEHIHDNTPTSTSYIVLSNILTAAASVERYGFTTYYNTPQGSFFYYAIPSGSPLAQLFNRMLYEGQKREYMDTAMADTGTNRAYFVVHSYWDNAEKIVAGATATADRMETVESGKTKIWIFIYDKTQPSSGGTKKPTVSS